MQSSLDSGLSGMTSHQLMLDVVATNLANVSTPGFKGSQASFANALSQTDYAGAQPGDNLGGRNPEQIGLGVQTGAIEVNMKQGSLQETGRTLDLAVQGAGFFQVAKMNNGGAVIEPFYTRVGNFDFDKANTMVDLATGLKVVGLRTDLNGVTQGTAGAIDITDDRAMPAAATQNVTFQGNLSAADGALQGNSLTAGFPLMAVDPGNHSSVATEDTPLSTLTAFNTANGNRFTPPVPPALGDRTIYVFGTKPDGNAYAGNFTINPWTDSVGTLISRINTVLTQGSDNFGKVALDNGNLTATGLGDGQDFSLFLGESDPIAGVSAFVPTAAAVPGLTGVTASPATTAAYTVPTALAGALETTFTIPAGTTLAAPLVIATQVNGVTVNSLSIPAGTYAVATPFTLASVPNV
jgi:flagellar hook protein FlgE